MRKILTALLLMALALTGIAPVGTALESVSLMSPDFPVMPTFAPVPTRQPSATPEPILDFPVMPTFAPVPTRQPSATPEPILDFPVMPTFAPEPTRRPAATPEPMPTFAPVPTMPPPPGVKPEPQPEPPAFHAALTADVALEKALYAGDQAAVTYITASPDGRILVGYVKGELALFYPEAGGYVRVRFDEARNAAMGDMKRAREFFRVLEGGTISQPRLKGVEHAAWSQDGRYVVLSNLMMGLQLLSVPQGVYYIDTATATLVCARNEAGAQGNLLPDTLTFASAFSEGHTLWSQRWHAGADGDMLSIDLDTLEASKPFAIPAVIEQPMLNLIDGMAYWPSMNLRTPWYEHFDGIHVLNLETGQSIKHTFDQGRTLGLFDIHSVTKRGIIHGFRGDVEPTLTRFRLLDNGAFEGLNTVLLLEDLTGVPRAREVAYGDLYPRDASGTARTGDAAASHPEVSFAQMTADGRYALIAARPTQADDLVLLLMDMETLAVARVSHDGGALDGLPQVAGAAGAFQNKSESGFECFADGLVILDGRLFRLTVDA